MIIVTGTLAYDYIMDFKGRFGDHILPDQIHKLNLSFTVDTFAKRFGGTAGNVSYNLGFLGSSHVLLSIAGKDFEEYRKHLEKAGVETKFVKKDESEYMTTGFAMTDIDDNQIWGYSYGPAKNMHTLRLSGVATKDDFVLITSSGAKGTMSFVKQCIDGKIPYMFDAGFILPELTNDELSAAILKAEIIVGNDYEIEMIMSRFPDFEQRTQDKTVITTLGSKGSKVRTKDGLQTILAAKPQKVTDPTGAGDAWRAGFLSGFQRGLKLDMCAQIGSVVASFAIEKYGAQEHQFSKGDIENRYRQTFAKSLKL